MNAIYQGFDLKKEKKRTLKKIIYVLDKKSVNQKRVEFVPLKSS